MKTIARKIGIITLASLVAMPAVSVSELVYAEDNPRQNNKPELEIYQAGDSVRAEWAVDILDDDVLYQTGFEENDELPNLVYGSIDKGGGRQGGQSFTSETSYSGSRSLRVEDTYKNGQQVGNPVNGIVPFSNMSRTRFLEPKFIDDGIDLSMSLKVKTVGGVGNLRPEAQGTNGDYGIPMKEVFMENVNVGDYTVKVSDITPFKSAIDEGKLYYLADKPGKYNRIGVVSYDSKKSTITTDKPFRYNFKKGDSIIGNRYVVPLVFPERDVNSQNWTTVNMNTRVPKYDYFNIKENGFTFVLFNTTKNIMYIDDLKMGYATQTELYRDGTKVYEGKLSDFDDKDAVDNESPDEVVDYEITKETGKQYINIIEPKDNGTTYNYQLKAISNDESGEYLSDSKSIVKKSGLKGYSYVIDKNKATTTDGQINSTTGKIEVNKDVYKDHYLHIQSIDKAGNKSATSHIKLSKVNDIYPPNLELTQTPTDWTNGGVTINVNADDSHSGIKEIFVTGEDAVKNGDFSDGVNHWHGGDGDADVVFEDGVVVLADSTKARDKLNQLVFVDGIEDAKHYVEVEARGTGVLNARRGVGGGPAEENPIELKNEREFKVYSFPVNRNEYTNKSLVVERVGYSGHIEIKSVKVYERKEVENNKLVVYQNGKYTITAIDNANNLTSKEIEVTNIDNTSPTFSIEQDVTEITHENVTLKINAKDDLSGVKSITYLGENMIKNGDFSQGEKHWNTNVILGGNSRVEGGVAYLDDKEAYNNKIGQDRAFQGSSIGEKYFAKVLARGKGVLNARYLTNESMEASDRNNKQNLKSETKFEEYTFPIIRHGESIDDFIIERINPEGFIEIKGVEVHAQKDITDTKMLEVTKNGRYTFLVEDYAGNVTTKTHVVDNIVKELSFVGPEVKGTIDSDISEEMRETLSIGSINLVDWRDDMPNDWTLSVGASQLSGPADLPSGTISIAGVKEVLKTDGTGRVPLINVNDESIIDDGSIRLVDGRDSRGAYRVSFGENALIFNFNPSTIKKGKYKTRLTWTLEAAP